MSIFHELEERLHVPGTLLARAFSAVAERFAKPLQTSAVGMLVVGALVAVAALFVAFPQLIPYPEGRGATARPKAPIVAMQAPQRVAAVAAAPPISAAAAGQKPQTAAALTYRMVDDGVDRATGVHFTYAGPWTHLRNVPDGRSNGTSSRTYKVGATASLRFRGRHFKLFGVKGPTGGYASLAIDGKDDGPVPFYAPSKEAGVLVFASPALRPGSHEVEIVVAEAPARSPKRRFVNIDGAAYSER